MWTLITCLGPLSYIGLTHLVMKSILVPCLLNTMWTCGENLFPDCSCPGFIVALLSFFARENEVLIFKLKQSLHLEYTCLSRRKDYHAKAFCHPQNRFFDMNHREKLLSSCWNQSLNWISPTLQQGWKGFFFFFFFFFKKVSFDFHILYDFIIHTLQNWLPVNLITVTPISHKYANTIQTSWVLREQMGL